MTNGLSLSYPLAPGHPADKAVRLRVSRPDGSELRVLVEFNGGQGHHQRAELGA
ncbi:MAG: hypothetical protein U1E15_08975 [Hyphomicrobiales bacterium]